MRKLVLILSVLLVSFSATAQDIFGKWVTVDDQTGEEKSIVEIYKRDGKIYGKVAEVFDASKRDLPCIKCTGEDYNKPILGMEIIRDMEKDGDYYKKGTVLDPQDGKLYKLRLSLDEDDSDVLMVRGYIGFFYSTQYWKRSL